MNSTPSCAPTHGIGTVLTAPVRAGGVRLADMAGRGATARPPLITSARFGTSLSTDQRTKRYIVTMSFRVVAFLAAVVSPTPWNAVLFIAAALLPGIAVLLGNATDNRPPPLADPDEDDAATRPALTTGGVVRGEVDDGVSP